MCVCVWVYIYDEFGNYIGPDIESEEEEQPEPQPMVCVRVVDGCAK